MNLRPESLSNLLGLPPQWEPVSMITHEGVVGVQAQFDYRPPGQCRCAGLPGWIRHGRGSHTYRALPLGAHPVTVQLTYPRYRCPKCRGGAAPQLPPGTVLPSFAAVVGQHALQATVSDTCRRYHVGRGAVLRCLDEAIAAGFAERVVPAPQYVGLDDTQIAGARRAVWVDLPRARHIEVLAGYSAGAVAEFLAAQRPVWEGTLRGLVIDPAPGYRSAALRAWPELPVILDRYHIALLINQARARWADAYRAAHPKLGSLRALRQPDTPAAQELRARLVDHPEVPASFEYAQAWQGLYECETASEARAHWRAWVEAMPEHLRSHLGPTVGHLDRTWRTEVCAAVEHRLPDGNIVTNGRTEALHKRATLMRMRSGGMGFDLARSRLLLHVDPVTLQADESVWDRRIQQCTEQLRAHS